MTLALTLWSVLSLAELLIWWRPLWPRRNIVAPLSMVSLILITSTLLIIHPGIWTIFIAIWGMYRALNLGKLISNRVHENYLFYTTRRTAWWLIGLQAMTLLLAYTSQYLEVGLFAWWYGLATFQILAAAVMLASTVRHLRTTTPPSISLSIADKDLPTVTVAIPARNETVDLEACLHSVLASTYPKLEILVLDDCSQNKRTPEIIRDFAHDGVRFIGGQTPPANWLAKNYAYHQLYAASNGEVVLFCGVDVRFKPESIRMLVETMVQKRKTMLSVIPQNIFLRQRIPKGLFLQANRYTWELSLPRKLMGRPPVLSTCWMITRPVLDAAGGFGAVTRKITPESYFARFAARTEDGYSFMQSSAEMGLTTEKQLAAQLATAIRTRYPQLHRRPEMVAVFSLLQLGVLVWPFIVGIVSLLNQLWALAIVSFVACWLSAIAYSLVVNMTYRRFTISALGIFPLTALYDIGLLNYSMWQYEFRDVLWKGRNVCLPVMQVLPKLPVSS